MGEVQLKVCGLTSASDAQAAVSAGADYLGFIFYPKSPRYVTHAQYQAMSASLPARPRVAVAVEPELSEVEWFIAQGFPRVQIHFRIDLPLERIAVWSRTVSPEKLWLAPKIPPGTPFPAALLPYAHTFMLDTYSPDKFGGTGKTGDWGNFHELKDAHPDKTWILSGGLSPANVGEALKITGTQFLDVNSGVEISPGIKDPGKLNSFAGAVRSALGTTRST